MDIAMNLDDTVPSVPLYHPLKPNEIRLALLEPSPDDDHDGPLSHSGPAPYDAISYVWGDDTADTVPIPCDGVSVGITSNLHWALTRAREHRRISSASFSSPATTDPNPVSPAAAVLIWADALCINQRDPAERSDQVSLMGRIYAGARTVLVCMGPNLSNGGGAHVASLLRDWQQRAVCAPAPTAKEKEKPTTWNEVAVDPIIVHDDDPRWRALGALTGAPWFERVWVLQEVGLARDPRVIYGGRRRDYHYRPGFAGDDGSLSVNSAPGAGAEKFSYRLLRQVVAWTRQRRPEFAAYMGIGGLHIHDWWSDWSQLRAAVGGEGVVAGVGAEIMQQPWHYQFLDLLDHGALLRCRDPRDRRGRPIVPDYGKSVLQVFRETTMVLLRDSGVRTLSSVEHDGQTIEEDTPSWVVRWDVTPTFNNVWSSHNQEYRAGTGIIGAGGPLKLDGDYLRVEGIVLDSICAVFPVKVVPSQLQILFTSAHIDHWQPLAQFASELEQDTSAPFGYNTTSAKAAVLAHTLCGHRWDGQDQETGHLRAYADYISCEGRNRVDFAQMAGPFYWRAESLCRGRAFVITSKGYYGLAPRICRPGDICAVVQDGAVPLLLRPQSSGVAGGGDGSVTPKRLVGEIYLHGFMEGHAASMVGDGMLRKELLSIR
ncbi:hypothetical protein PG984_016237 [Apiospora sp. TS-2023a]